MKTLSRIASSSHQDAYINQTYVLILVEYIKHHHPQPDEMLTSLGLSTNFPDTSKPCDASSINHINTIDGRIALTDFTAILKRIDPEMNQSMLAIEIGRHITAAHFGVLGYLIVACADLTEALTLLNRYARLLNDHFEMITSLKDDTVVMSWDIPNDENLLFYEMGLAAMMQFTSNLIGQIARPLEVHLRSRRPDHVDYYESFYGCPVHFDQAEMLVKLPIALLATPVKQSDKMLLDLLSKQADQALAALPQDGEWTKKVRQEIVRLCHEDTPTLAKVSSNLFVTPRTLQRHLADEGLRFQPLLDETRLRLAEQYLNEGQLQLTDIAELLGYSDQSALTRAFKRWTGHTPKDIRKSS
jgi:AraC-like DNA-binding protein